MPCATWPPLGQGFWRGQALESGCVRASRLRAHAASWVPHHALCRGPGCDSAHRCSRSRGRLCSAGPAPGLLHWTKTSSAAASCASARATGACACGPTTCRASLCCGGGVIALDSSRPCGATSRAALCCDFERACGLETRHAAARRRPCSPLAAELETRRRHYHAAERAPVWLAWVPLASLVLDSQAWYLRRPC